MRWFGRALAWSISFAAHHRWAAVAGDLRRVAAGRRARVRTSWSSPTSAATSSSTATAASRPPETITTRFPSGRHGIFRYWDVANQNDSHIRQVPQVTEILLDDQPVPYKMLWQNQQRFLVAKIGDPDRYLDFGTHVFRIRYTIDGCSIRGRGARRPSPPRSATPGPRRRSSGTSSPRAGTTRSTAPTSRSRCPAVCRGAVLGRLRRRSAVRRPGDHRRPGGVVGHQPAALHPGDAARRVDVPTPPRAELPWSYRWDRCWGGRCKPCCGCSV